MQTVSRYLGRPVPPTEGYYAENLRSSVGGVSAREGTEAQLRPTPHEFGSHQPTEPRGCKRESQPKLCPVPLLKIKSGMAPREATAPHALGAFEQENIMLVGTGSKEFSARKLAGQLGTCGGFLSWAWGWRSPFPTRPACWKRRRDSLAARSLGNPQGCDLAFISARSAVVGASGKKTKAPRHCGQGLGFLTLCWHSLPSVVVEGRFLKVCVEFPPRPPIDRYTRKSKKPIPLLSLSLEIKKGSLGSCPFLCLPREVIFLCTERKIGERFCFTRFNSSITKDNKVRLSSQLGEPELASPRGGAADGLCALALSIFGDDCGLPRFLCPAPGSSTLCSDSTQRFSPNLV